MQEDEQPIDPSELPPDFIDSSSESDCRLETDGSDFLNLDSDAEDHVDPDSEVDNNQEEGVDYGETYDSD